jgi:hypothetical protein
MCSSVIGLQSQLLQLFADVYFNNIAALSPPAFQLQCISPLKLLCLQ